MSVVFVRRNYITFPYLCVVCAIFKVVLVRRSLFSSSPFMHTHTRAPRTRTTKRHKKRQNEITGFLLSAALSAAICFHFNSWRFPFIFPSFIFVASAQAKKALEAFRCAHKHSHAMVLAPPKYRSGKWENRPELFDSIQTNTKRSYPGGDTEAKTKKIEANGNLMLLGVDALHFGNYKYLRRFT